ncbi:MAG TPA: AgmX/PglI C-terminal domain-containing protein [Chitinivibrionales bacterium]|nr:AgmX/PglI C-terminal domain-containing protein [Chitinivibrionales bacterium]
MRLKQQFEAIGAEIELVALGAPVAPAAAAAEEGEEVYGRTLTDPEYAQVLGKRPDIFHIERDAKLRNLLIVCMILGLVTGVWMSTVKVVQVATDFFEKIPEERVAKFVKGDVDATLEDQKKKKEEEEKMKKEEEKKLESDKKTLKKESDKKGAGGKFGGGGDPRARVTQKGVLGIISGKITGKAVASADIFGKGGFATGIDGILSGLGGLKAGGSGGVGRKGAAGIGFGAGYGSGFGGGSGFSGVDDLIGGLLGGEGESSLSLKKRGSLTVSEPKFVKGGALTGGRSRASIMRVVMQNLAALRYAYNKRLREKPGLKGKITCKFAIDEFGKVIFCQVLESTMSDPQLEQEVVDKIKRWVFEKIDKPGDITEVEYPFAFSQ